MQGLNNQLTYKQEVLPQVPPLMQVDPRVNGQPLMDPNMIIEAIRLHFGAQLRPLDKPIYRTIYLDWVDNIPLLGRYKTLDFSAVLGEDGKSTMEHISYFMAQYGDAS